MAGMGPPHTRTARRIGAIVAEEGPTRTSAVSVRPRPRRHLTVTGQASWRVCATLHRRIAPVATCGVNLAESKRPSDPRSLSKAVAYFLHRPSGNDTLSESYTSHHLHH